MESSSNSFHSLGPDNMNCDWQITLKDCEDATTYKELLLISSIISFVLFISSTLILYWKLCRSSNKSNKVWKIYEWSPMDLIIFWISAYCLCKWFYTTITAFDLFADQILLRALSFRLSFIPGYYIVLIHLGNIFRLIPRLGFDQTSNSVMKKIYIPKDKQVTIILWFLSLFILFIVITSGLMIGISIINKKDIFIQISKCLDIILTILQIFFGICLTYYGRISVDLTNQSMVLAGIDDANYIEEPGRSKILGKITKLHFHKIQIFNIICGTSILVYSSLNIFVLIFYQEIYKIYFFEMLNIVVLTFGSLLFTLILIIAIFIPELLTESTM